MYNFPNAFSFIFMVSVQSLSFSSPYSNFHPLPLSKQATRKEGLNVPQGPAQVFFLHPDQQRDRSVDANGTFQFRLQYIGEITSFTLMSSFDCKAIYTP